MNSIAIVQKYVPFFLINDSCGENLGFASESVIFKMVLGLFPKKLKANCSEIKKLFNFEVLFKRRVLKTIISQKKFKDNTQINTGWSGIHLSSNLCNSLRISFIIFRCSKLIESNKRKFCIFRVCRINRSDSYKADGIFESQRNCLSNLQTWHIFCDFTKHAHILDETLPWFHKLAVKWSSDCSRQKFTHFC